MSTGIIKTIVTDRGYGFIRPTDGDDDLFFHISASTFSDSDFGPQLRELEVDFDVETDSARRQRAVNVKPAR
jgi:cold shock CspA family protein